MRGARPDAAEVGIEIADDWCRDQMHDLGVTRYEDVDKLVLGEICERVESLDQPVAARLHGTYTDEAGNAEVLEGESVEEIAAQLPADGASTVTIYDEPGFVRGWARNPRDWRAN